MKQFLKSSSFVFLGALSLGVTACGQNANVTKHDSVGSTGTGIVSGGTPNTIVQKGDKGDKGDAGEPGPGGTQGPQGEQGPAGPQGIQGIPGPQGLPGLPGLNGINGINGKDGKDGINGKDGAQGPKGDKGDAGKDGRDGKDGCGVRTFTYEFEARPFDPRDRAALPADALPYVSSSNHKIGTLDLGEMTGLASGNYPYVKNSQVEFAIDVSLPPQASIVSIKQMSLKVRATKIAQDCNLRDEVLCFLDEKICSGETNQAQDWQGNINPKFFDKYAKPVNDFFATQYLERVVAEIPIYRTTKTEGAPETQISADHSEAIGASIGLSGIRAGKTEDDHTTVDIKPGQTTIERVQIGTRKVYSDAMTLPIASLLVGSNLDPMSFIYGNRDSANGLDRTLHFVVAANTFVDDDARLVLTLQADTCKMGN